MARQGRSRGKKLRSTKVLLCVSVDWFTLSHFKPLRDIAADVVVVTQVTERAGEIEDLGASVIDFDYQRASMNPLNEIVTARRLAAILRAEQPDAVHLIAMKPIVLGALAMRFTPMPAAILHMTGLGHLAIASTLKTRAARRVALYLIAGALSPKKSWLLVENADDLDLLQANGVRPGERVTILGGAGIDPDAFSAAQPPQNARIIAASVGRMIHSKGLDVLVGAHEILRHRGVALDIELYGRSDDGNPEGIAGDVLRAWAARPGVKWPGATNDVAAVWHRVDIAVSPARSREGMPRALLEAAASGKPLIVSDVPGCRHFVRDGLEGLIVPPENPEALADALALLAGDAKMRKKMGQTARARVLDGFTEDDVRNAYDALYRQLL